jgi:hypothetical protein
MIQQKPGFSYDKGNSVKELERDVHHTEPAASFLFSQRSFQLVINMDRRFTAPLFLLSCEPPKNIKSLKGQSGDMKLIPHICVWLNMAMRKRHHI